MAGRWMDSRVGGAEIGRRERILGYFIGPCLMAMVYSGVAGSYLIQFYTDVLGISGAILVMMPLISKGLAAASGVVLGRMIERTRTRQGKARPYLLVSGLLMAAGAPLYAVPRGTYELRIAWIVISYNLFFSLIYALYSLSHSMMVPLSTRDEKQRDGLAMLSSTATSMLPGMLTTVLMPLMVGKIGVGAQAQGAWLSVMGALSALAIPAALIEYYFTLERVTLEGAERRKAESASFKRVAAACLRSREWVGCMIFILASNLAMAFSNGSMIYYCNWVLGSSVSEGAVRQVLVNVIGQLPMGIGVLLLWPLVGRFGRRKVSCAGFAIAAAGSLMAALGGSSLPVVLTGLIVRSFGSLPVYTLAAHQAEALESVEREHGLRADGFTASAVAAVGSVAPGLAQTVLLCGMNALGYEAPAFAEQTIVQNAAVQGLFSGCFALVPAIGYALCALVMLPDRRTIDGGSIR